jgi:hypothetical protein
MKNNNIKYPQVKVKLVGEDGNAFFILGRCSYAAKNAGVPQEEIDKFMEEAKSSDYDNLLRTCMKWFDCE